MLTVARRKKESKRWKLLPLPRASSPRTDADCVVPADNVLEPLSEAVYLTEDVA